MLHQFDALSNKHYNKIMHKYDVEEDDLKDALDEISKLSPKVGVISIRRHYNQSGNYSGFRYQCKGRKSYSST